MTARTSDSRGGDGVRCESHAKRVMLLSRVTARTSDSRDRDTSCEQKQKCVTKVGNVAKCGSFGPVLPSRQGGRGTDGTVLEVVSVRTSDSRGFGPLCFSSCVVTHKQKNTVCFSVFFVCFCVFFAREKHTVRVTP